MEKQRKPVGGCRSMYIIHQSYINESWFYLDRILKCRLD